MSRVEGTALRRLCECRDAQRAWAHRAIECRLAVLRRFRYAVARRAQALVDAVGQSDRRACGETLAAEVLPLAEACRYLERRARGVLAPRRDRARFGPPPIGGTELEVRREPWGVVLVIGPSNYPLLLPGVQALQALAAGNAVLLKPAPGGLLVAELVRELLIQAGLDEGLFCVLSESVEAAKGAIEAGVDKVVLTGSVASGRAVLRQLALHTTPAVMELSGCDAMYVMPEADLDLVARAAAFGVTANGGATCIAPRRAFVPRNISRELEERLRHRLRDAGSARLQERAARLAARLVREALADGARIVTGEPPSGCRMRPLLLAGVSPETKLVQQDVFAPVLSILPVRDMQEAVRADEQCPYALGASVFGPERSARRLARSVRAGCVTVNDIVAPTADPRLPFGGWDASGYGVTRGREGLLAMTRVKTIAVARGRLRPHLRMQRAGDGQVMESIITLRHDGRWRARARALLALLRAVLQGSGETRAQKERADG